ncbi:MAG: serine hydroxymethyltransferase, partial [Pseudomonadota bacterium]
MPDTSAPARFDTATFFSEPLESRDRDVFAAVAQEQTRQQHQIELIASENIASQAV